MKGCYTLGVLSQIEKRYGPLADHFDMLCGTSTGSIIAALLAHGKSADHVANMYIDNGRDIFKNRFGSLWRAKYNNKVLKELLQRELGHLTTLGDLGTHVLIPAYDIRGRGSNGDWNAKFFHNLPNGTGEELAWKACLASASAPTYFPSFDGYVDGGLAASNPVTCGICQLLDDRTPISDQPISLGDIWALSVGTGIMPKKLKSDVDWGLLRWAADVIGIALDSLTDVETYKARQLLDGRLIRIDTVMPDGFSPAMDQPEHAERLYEIGLAVPVPWDRIDELLSQ